MAGDQRTLGVAGIEGLDRGRVKDVDAPYARVRLLELGNGGRVGALLFRRHKEEHAWNGSNANSRSVRYAGKSWAVVGEGCGVRSGVATSWLPSMLITCPCACGSGSESAS